MGKWTVNIRSLTAALAGALMATTALSAAAMAAELVMEPLGTHATGIFDEGASEIVTYDATAQRLYVVNADAKTVDILDISDPSRLKEAGKLDAAALGKQGTSVAVHDGLIAVAISADPKTANGKLGFFDAQGKLLNAVDVGANPDMVTFTPDGKYALVANEGEPNDAYTVDPVGSVSVVDLTGGVENATVKTAGFEAFDGKPLPKGLRIAKPGATVSQDMEPEYIAVSKDGRTAWVTLQENNGIAILDIPSAIVKKMVGLGYKDWSKSALDPSNKDGGVRIQPWPVWGMYQPDSIAAFEADGKTYLVIANEGDARDYDGFSEETRVKKLDLDPTVFPPEKNLQNDAQLGRLKVTTTMGDENGDGKYEKLYAFGGRSFSILDADGTMIFDSGDDLERRTARALPGQFNNDNDENKPDGRSDDKGPEPEGVAVGEVDGVTYAFIGLERIGGIMAYDVSDPARPRFAGYVNTRNFKVEPEAGKAAGDVGPEGMAFIPAASSPNGEPLLAVGFEVSGSTTIYSLKPKK